MAFWKPGSVAPGVALERSADSADAFVYNPQAHLSIQKQRQLLPVYAHRAEILYAVEKYACVIVVGQTGCGKSTQIPQYLDEAGWAAAGRQLVCTQPRSLAAATLAARVAHEANVELGSHVGYAIPFEQRLLESKTRIRFVTDAMLIHEMMSDPLLSSYSVVMVDEAHERSLHTDLLMGLLKKIQRRRSDLRIVIASATLDVDLFKAFFETNKTSDPALDKTVVISVEGTIYPVDIMYSEFPVKDYVEASIDTAMKIHKFEKPGDVLAFLPTKTQIDAAVSAVRERVSTLPIRERNLRALPLFAGMSQKEQFKVFESDRTCRKIIFSTNIAEASLTIPSISYVIDCGLTKEAFFDPESGIEWLSVVPVSTASADQRAGRAGRVRSGKCFRLFTDVTAKTLQPHSVPAMQRCNLASTLLRLKCLGVDDLVHFDFISPPSFMSMSSALEHLYALGALDDYCKLTECGSMLADLPVEPPMAKALLAACDLGCSEDLVDIAAMLSVKEVWTRPRNRSFGTEAEKAHRRFAVAEGDLLTLLNVWRTYDSNSRDPAWCQENWVDHKSLQRAARIRKRLRLRLRQCGLPLVAAGDDVDCIRRAIVSGFFSNAVQLQRDGSYRSVRGERQLFIHPTSVLVHEAKSWLVFFDVMHTDNYYIRDVTSIEPQWLAELAPNFYDAAP